MEPRAGVEADGQPQHHESPPRVGDLVGTSFASWRQSKEGVGYSHAGHVALGNA